MDAQNKKKCSNCRWFMSPDDRHPCRTCTRENGCPLEKDWSEEDWKSFDAKKASLKASREKARANLKNQSVSRAEPSPRGGIRETISLQAAGSPRRPSVGVLTESSVPTLCLSFQSALDKDDTGNPTSKVPPRRSKSVSPPQGFKRPPRS